MPHALSPATNITLGESCSCKSLIFPVYHLEGKERRHEGQDIFSTHLTYQDGGDDEGAVSQGVGDVHPFSLRHFSDVETSWRTPLPHLRKMERKNKKHVAKCSAFVGWAVTPRGLPRQPVSHISARLNTSPAALDDWLGHLCISGPGCFGKHGRGWVWGRNQAGRTNQRKLNCLMKCVLKTAELVWLWKI